jgi:hypothetical protein
MKPEQQRIIIMVLAGIFGIMVIIGVGYAIYQSQKGKITYNTTPKDAIVKLDGQEVPGSGTKLVEPGKHQFVITRSAFVEKKIDFEIKAGESKGFDLFIIPNDNAGLEWVKQNPEEASELDGKVSNEYIETAERITNSHQILKDLPIAEATFRINHGRSEKGNDFALYIQAADQAGRDDALATLDYLGYDPKNFEIIYTTPGN